MVCFKVSNYQPRKQIAFIKTQPLSEHHITFRAFITATNHPSSINTRKLLLVQFTFRASLYFQRISINTLKLLLLQFTLLYLLNFSSSSASNLVKFSSSSVQDQVFTFWILIEADLLQSIHLHSEVINVTSEPINQQSEPFNLCLHR